MTFILQEKVEFDSSVGIAAGGHGRLLTTCRGARLGGQQGLQDGLYQRSSNSSSRIPLEDLLNRLLGPPPSSVSDSIGLIASWSPAQCPLIVSSSDISWSGDKRTSSSL